MVVFVQCIRIVNGGNHYLDQTFKFKSRGLQIANRRMNKPRTHLYFTSFLRNPQTVKQLIHFECFHLNQDWTLQMFHAFNVFISIKITIVNILCFFRTRVRSLLVLIHSLTDILLFSQLDCNESG